MREPLSLGYLLARASDTIADAGSLGAGERRELLARFCELASGGAEDCQSVDELRSVLRSAGGLSDPGECALVERLPDCLAWLREIENEAMRSAIVEVLEVITAGQRWDIERFEIGAGEDKDEDERALRFCESAAELDAYTYRVAGCVGEFWTRVGYLSGVKFAAPESREPLMTAGKFYGQGLQLVNILRDLGGDLGKGRCYLPHDELMAEGWRKGEAWTVSENRAALVAVADRWRQKARDQVLAGEAYAGVLESWRVRLATRLPGRLGLRTLAALDAAGAGALDQRVKISRGEVWRELAGCAVARR